MNEKDTQATLAFIITCYPVIPVYPVSCHFLHKAIRQSSDMLHVIVADRNLANPWTGTSQKVSRATRL